MASGTRFERPTIAAQFRGAWFSALPTSRFERATIAAQFRGKFFVDLPATRFQSAVPIPPPPPPETTPPAISNILPAPGTAIARNGPLQFTVTDDGPMRRVLVLIIYPDGSTEVAHDGDGFMSSFAALSSRTAVVGPAGWAYRIQRANGWPQAPSFRIVAIDAVGNEV